MRSGDPGHPVTTAERLAELMPHASLSIARTAGDLASWTQQTIDFIRSLGSPAL